jgi:hypothetical protein
MTDDKITPNVDDQPEQAKPERSDQDAQLAQPTGAGAPARPSESATPGRRPLFRN